MNYNMIKPESPRSFKERMLHRLHQDQTSFPVLDLSESSSTVFSQLWQHKKLSLTEPDYSQSKSSSFNFLKDSIILHLVLGRGLYKYIEQCIVNYNPTSEEEHFKLFKHFLYRWDLDQAYESISKCAVINPKKYHKWKCLTLFHMKQLDVNAMKNTKDWDKEADLIWVFQSLSEEKADQLMKKDEFFGALAWIKLFSSSCHPDKEMIVLNICKKLLDKFPNMAECYFIALHLMIRHDLSQAAELCESIFERMEKSISDELVVYLKITQGKILHLQSKTNQCLDYLRDSYMQHPTFMKILYYFGKFCISSNRQNISHYAIGALKSYMKYENTNNVKALLLLTKTYCFRNQVFKTVKNYMKLENQRFSFKNQKILNEIAEKFNHEIHYMKNLEKTGNVNQDFLLHIEAMNLIKIKDNSESLKKLRGLQIRQESEMKYYIEEVKILGSISDSSYLTKNNELLKKITASKITSSQWEKTILFYSKNTVCLESFEDAIKILTCIGYIYPSLPLELPFINRTFNASKSIKDIIITASADSDDLKGRRKAEKMVVTYSELVSSPKQRRYSSQIPRPNFFKGLNQVRDSCFLNPDNNVKQLERLPTSTSSLFTSSFPLYLYKIGKISSLYSVKEFEGILALQDFLSILFYFNFSSVLKSKYIPKGQFFLCCLLKSTSQESKFNELFEESKDHETFKALSRKHQLL